MGESKSKFNIYKFVCFILFIICMIYILFSYIKSFFKNHSNIYQVENGVLINQEILKGFIYRDEVLVIAKKDGFASFTCGDNQKIAKDSIVMILTDKNYNEDNINYEIDKNKIYDKLIDYNKKVDKNSFYNIYSYHNIIDNYITDIKNSTMPYMDTKAYKDNNKVMIFAQKSGIISFCIDGYENQKIEDYNENLLYKNEYCDNIYKNFYKKDDVVCKIVYNPTYNLVFDSNSNFIKNYINKKIKIKIKDNEDTIDTLLTTIKTKDNKEHYCIKLDKYLEDYLNYRVLDFSIIYKESEGLKVPLSCLYRKNCYSIERKFVELNEIDNDYYVYKVDASGNKIKIKIDISYTDDKYYYVLYDDNDLHLNDKLMYKGEYFNITNVKYFDGVFVVNKGYKVFKIVDIMDKNDEYCIIKRDQKSKLKEYDILLLNIDF